VEITLPSNSRVYPLTALTDCDKSSVTLANLRGYPIPSFAWEAESLESYLHVAERVRKAVVFIGAESKRGFTPYGTALIGIVKHDDYSKTVIVTARHVVDMIAGDFIFVRINRKEGGANSIKLPKLEMISFTKRAVDICIFERHFDPSIYDFYGYILDSLRWKDEWLEAGDLKTGDEVCVVGLYTSHYGITKNMPVVRIGNIAALPDEPITTDYGNVHGCLIECYSIAGLSGSPVFKVVPKLTLGDNGIVKMTEVMYVLIGILVGEHVIESKEDEHLVPEFQLPENEDCGEKEKKPLSLDQRRTGFAVVIPIQHAFRVFESDDYVNRFKKEINERQRESGYRPLSASATLATDENPNHLEDFSRLVDVAARRRSRGDQS
jgi:hypothetical protein